MRKLMLIFLSVLVHVAGAQDGTPPLTPLPGAMVTTRPHRFSGGTGMEVRGQQGVNPQLTEGKILPHFFAQYRLTAIKAGVGLEGGSEERSTSSGAFKVEARTINLGLWGRYEFMQPLRWSPFLSMGVGAYFDTVTSKFESERDQRGGRRDYFGMGGGVSTALWDHLLLEAEMRAALIQDRKDIAYSGIVRIGFVL